MSDKSFKMTKVGEVFEIQMDGYSPKEIQETVKALVEGKEEPKKPSRKDSRPNMGNIEEGDRLVALGDNAAGFSTIYQGNIVTITEVGDDYLEISHGDTDDLLVFDHELEDFHFD